MAATRHVYIVAIVFFSLLFQGSFNAYATYGEGIYGSNEYSGDTPVVVPGSGGGGGGSRSGGSSRNAETVTQANATSTVTSASASSTGCVLAPTLSAEDREVGRVVSLLIVLSIIPPEKAEQACSLFSVEAARQEPTNVITQELFVVARKLGDRGQDVYRLQVFLNQHGVTVATVGPGSRGQETEYFGPATLAAVKRFQEQYRSEILVPVNLTTGTGYFGPSTMRKVNALISR